MSFQQNFWHQCALATLPNQKLPLPKLKVYHLLHSLTVKQKKSAKIIVILYCTTVKITCSKV